MLEKQNGQSDSSLEGVPPINKPVPLPRTHVTVDEPAEGLEAQNPTISLPPKPEVIVAPKPILSDAETTPVPTTNSKSSEKVTLKTPAATGNLNITKCACHV